MTRYHGGSKVGPGVYFNAKQLTFTSMAEDGVLPGTAADEYRAVPVIVLFVVGPVLGLIYAIFLPFIGLAMIGWVLMQKLAPMVAGATAGAARALRPAWQPGMAFLARMKRGKKAASGPDAWTTEVKEGLETEKKDA